MTIYGIARAAPERPGAERRSPAHRQGVRYGRRTDRQHDFRTATNQANQRDNVDGRASETDRFIKDANISKFVDRFVRHHSAGMAHGSSACIRCYVLIITLAIEQHTPV